jgi:exonuclease VII large subunit
MILRSVDRMLEQTLRPKLSALHASTVHAFQRMATRRRDELQDVGLTVQQHLFRFQTDLDHIEQGLRREARSVLVSAGELRCSVGEDASRLYRAVGVDPQSRWFAGAANAPRVPPSVDALESLIARQSNALERLLSQVEISARRRISAEFDRLRTLTQAVDALGLDGTLARGFAVPLDHNRQIIRTANALRYIASFELLFRDGSVACRRA